MAGKEDRVTVETPAGTETTVSRAAWDHTYQYRKGWTLVDGQPDLDRKTRDELNAIAVEKGVEAPEKLENKAAVIAAIERAG